LTTKLIGRKTKQDQAHIHRQANQGAHLLSQKAIRRRECIVMRHNMPDEVHSQVEIEAAERMDNFHPRMFD
jgi:hypothetical protein